jgi:hypothetical protein
MTFNCNSWYEYLTVLNFARLRPADIFEWLVEFRVTKRHAENICCTILEFVIFGRMNQK